MNLTPAQWRAISERLYMMDERSFRTALGMDEDFLADDYYFRDKFADVKTLAKALARISPEYLAALTAESV